MTGSCPVSARVCRETARERDEAHAEVERLRAAMSDLVRASAAAAGIAIEDGSEVSFRQIVDGLIGLVERCRTAEVEVMRLRDALIEERQTCWLAHPEGELR